MLDIDVTTEGEVRDKLYEYSRHFPRIKDYMISEIAKALAEHQKGSYLNGQYLNRITSETYNSVKFFKIAKGIFGVRPGSGVPGRLNYLNVFVRGIDSTGRVYAQGNFVGDSSATFFASGEPLRIAEGIARRTLLARFRRGVA